MPEETQQTQTESLGWRAGLPGDLQQSETFKPFKTVGDFAKNYLETTAKVPELEQRLSNSIPKLKDDASDAERSQYFDALGRPKQPSEYTVEGEDKNAPEWNTSYKQAFHSAGLTNTQAGTIGKWWNGQMTKMVEAHNAKIQGEMTAATEKLKSEWGDKFDTNVELAKRVYQKHIGTEFDKDFDAGTGTTRLATMRLIMKFAALTGEDRSPQGGNSITDKTAGNPFPNSKMPPART
jgi:hypothetical protein